MLYASYSFSTAPIVINNVLETNIVEHSAGDLESHEQIDGVVFQYGCNHFCGIATDSEGQAQRYQNTSGMLKTGTEFYRLCRYTCESKSTSRSHESQ